MKRPRGFDDSANSVVEHVEATAPELAVPEREQDGLTRAKRELREAKSARKRREKYERQRFTRAARVRRRRRGIVLVAVGLLAAFVFVGLVTPIMAVRDIEIHGVNSDLEERLQGALREFRGAPLALVNQDQIAARLGEFKELEQYSIQIIPPSTLSVYVTERVPRVAVQSGDKTFLLDSAGVIVKTVESDQKPTSIPLFVESGTVVGSPEFLAATRAVVGMPQELLEKVESVEAKTQNEVRLKLYNGVNVLWGPAEENAFKAMVLGGLLDVIDTSSVSQIDISSPKSPVFK